MPEEVPKTETVEVKPKDTVTEIILETTQQIEKHVSMKMQHSSLDDAMSSPNEPLSSLGNVPETNETVKTEPPCETLENVEEEVKHENDRERIEKELVEVKQQGSVQGALSKFKELETQIETFVPPKKEFEEFKQQHTSSETLIIKNISHASSVSNVTPIMTAGTVIPIEIEKKTLQPLIIEKPLNVKESVFYAQGPAKFEEPASAKTLILESGEEIEPGPPPEMGFIPKSEVPSKGQKEEVACKVKKLQEESQKVLSPVDIPSGAVRLFPVSTAAPAQTVTSIGTSSSAFTHWIGRETVIEKPIQSSVLGPIKREPISVAPAPEPSVPVVSEVPRKEFDIKQSSFVEHEEMTVKQDFKSEFFVQPALEIPQEMVLRPRSPITRPLTPGTIAPSAEGVAMEKLWASRKTPEPEVGVLTQPPPSPYHTLHRESTNSPRPSAEGVAMDRLWAHKNPDRSLKRVWPPKPVTTEEERTVPVWVTRSGSEPLKSPVSSSPVPQQQHCFHSSNVDISVIKDHTAIESTMTTQKMFETVSNEELKHISPPAQVMHPIAPPEKAFKPVPSPVQTFKPVPSPVQAFKPVPSPVQVFKPIPPPEQIKPIEPVKETAPAVSSDRNILHYIAHVTHLSTAAEKEAALISTEITSSSKTERTSSHMESTLEISAGGDVKPIESNSMVVEEKVLRPSEAKKVWPPGPHVEFEPMPPPPIKTGVQPQRHVETVSPKQPVEEELPIELEPGPPPEIGFMQPTLERRVSKVDTIELDLEKEPSKHIVGAVRTIPPPVKEKQKGKQEEAPSVQPVVSHPVKKSSLSDKKPKLMERPMSTPPISLSAFKPFPELEPFPFKPETGKKGGSRLPPPPKPSKFVKGDFTESDYESDMELTRIPSKWRPYGSDTESQPVFRRVKPPGSVTTSKRPISMGEAPLPPSAFEKEPPKLEGPTRPDVHTGATVKAEKSSKVQKVSGTKASKFEQEVKKIEQSEITEVTSTKFMKKQMTHSSKQTSVSEIPKRKRSPPGKTPITFTEPVPDKDAEQGNAPKSPSKGKPGSPKLKIKKEMTESGYMADTDEPIWQQKMQSKETKSSTVTTTSVSSTSAMASKFEQKEIDSSQEAFGKIPQKIHHHHQASSKFLQQQQIAAAAELIGEGMPMTGEQGVVKKPQKELIAPAIVKEIPISAKENVYKKDKIQVVPSPSKSSSIPTPIILPEPGSPPEERYAPPPPSTKLFSQEKKAPVDPLQAVETSKKMHFTESSETCHRVVSMEHTTRVIQFGEKEKGLVHQIRSQPSTISDTPRLVEIVEPALEPFPFKPEPQKPRKAAGPPPPKPKKFTKGEFRESDYESDVENVRIKPVWVPYESDSEEPKYRKVRPPSTPPRKSEGSDRGGPSPAPPSEFEKPPELIGPQKISLPSLSKPERSKVTTTVVKSEAEQKRLMRMEEMKRRFSGGTETQRHFQPVEKPSSFPDGAILQPGEKPEYGFAGGLPTSATEVASHHMSEMSHEFKSKAQQFVSEIMKTKEESKPNGLRPLQREGEEAGDGDPRSYREESRVSQFGTKCIDPDTGLIYFKYDFGYEFGVLLPGEGAGMGSKKAVAGGDGKPVFKPRDDDIAVPVIHEKSGTPDTKTKSDKPVSKLGGQSTPKGTPVVPQFRPKKFTHIKSVKWEPTSESELSDAEGSLPKGGGTRRLPQPAGGVSEPRIIIPTSPSIPPPLSSSPSSWKWVGGGDGGTLSPLSLSPRSLPSFSPHPQQQGGNIVAPLRITPGADSTAFQSSTSSWVESGMSPGPGRMGGVQSQGPVKTSHGRGNTPTPPSTPSTPTSAHGVYSLSPSQPVQPRKPPTFITPLRDIAVKSGGTARFECIVQAEPPPNILWSKNRRIIENSPDHEIHYRNGVCRLTIPEAYPEDAGTYTCTATNMLGTVGTSGSLQVPGEKRKPREV